MPDTGQRTYYIFYEIGCQGDRTSCHKGFAPCLRVTEGDRRVSGFAGYEIAAALVTLAFLKAVPMKVTAYERGV